MPVDCKLCGDRVSGSDGDSRCRCGWRLDGDCRDSHAPWCPASGAESWIGAQEF